MSGPAARRRAVLSRLFLIGEVRRMELNEFLRGKSAALAFSGGTDSALLLAAAVKAGCRVQPYFVDSAFQPRFERRDAERLASQLGVELRVIEARPLEEEPVRANGPLRCY